MPFEHLVHAKAWKSSASPSLRCPWDSWRDWTSPFHTWSCHFACVKLSGSILNPSICCYSPSEYNSLAFISIPYYNGFLAILVHYSKLLFTSTTPLSLAKTQLASHAGFWFVSRHHRISASLWFYRCDCRNWGRPYAWSGSSPFAILFHRNLTKS